MLTPVLSDNWDAERSWTLRSYEDQGGYKALRKAMAMALCDRALRADEFGEDIVAPAQDEEFVISHSDNVQATGFVEHLKLPHYVDFQAELGLVRGMRAEHEARQRTDEQETREAAE